MKRKPKVSRSLRVSALEHAAMQAKFLVDFLNNPDDADHPTVLEILNLCGQLHELRKTAPAVLPEKATDATWVFLRKRDYLLGIVNEALRPFQFTPMLDGGHSGWERYSTQWRAVIPAGKEAGVIPDTHVMVIPAISAIKLVLEILGNETIDRVSQCACGRWFFRSDRRLGCSDACRSQRFKASKDNFKAERAEYMRKYRQKPAVKKRGKKNAPRTRQKVSKARG